MTACIGRAYRFQQANAGNQSSGETSIARLSQSHAKHSALTTFHGPFGSSSFESASSFSFARSCVTPVFGSVTSVRHFHSMYRASFVSVSTGGGTGGFGIHDSPRPNASTGKRTVTVIKCTVRICAPLLSLKPET